MTSASSRAPPQGSARSLPARGVAATSAPGSRSASTRSVTDRDTPSNRPSIRARIRRARGDIDSILQGGAVSVPAAGPRKGGILRVDAVRVRRGNVQRQLREYVGERRGLGNRKALAVVDAQGFDPGPDLVGLDVFGHGGQR